MHPSISTLRSRVEKSQRLVFLGGAGVSTESGIPDFRSAQGLYSEESGLSISPEEILSRDFFFENTEAFYKFYREKMLYPKAEPNDAHRVLATWEGEGRLRALITQNIDGLHTKAGSRNVLELHGSLHRNICLSCGKHHGLDSILESQGIPRCVCGGIIKPDVVLYQEPLPTQVLAQAVAAVKAADMMIIAGTSLNVYPAAGLVEYFRGDNLVLINLTDTMNSRRKYLYVEGKVGQVLLSLARTAP